MPTVRFKDREYALQSGESVLGALLRGGANINFSCRKGTCQACMMTAVSGDPGAEAVKGLSGAHVELGCFLPCQAHPEEDLLIELPDPTQMYVNAHVQAKEWLSRAVCRLQLETESVFTWRAGQFVNVRREDGTVRSYSIASIADEDYYLEIHVKRLPGGTMSRWLTDEVAVGDVLQIQGPVGSCTYDPENQERNLLLLATGSGLSPMLGVARDALLHGHRGDVHLYHGSRYTEGLYLQELLAELATEHQNFHSYTFLTGEPRPDGVGQGRIVHKAFSDHPDVQGWGLYFCGIPQMVEEARVAAILAGGARSDIHADPFEYAHAHEPRDREKIAALEPTPELWAALDHGPGLMAIVREFYDIAFEDARLAPFFHRVTKQRAIEKQYEFLADLMTGDDRYFGLRPFNAHHWMIISDELFDYRERLFDECVRRSGLAEPLRRQWSAMHELFRREIVKHTARGIIFDGVELDREGYAEVEIDFPTVCDGCEGEMPIGVLGRLHNRTGELFCEGCGGASIN